MCFKEIRVDSLTKHEIIHKVRYTMHPKRDLVQMLLASSRGTKLGEEERKRVLQFGDLLKQIFTLDHPRRISVEKALQHPFVKSEK
jgi:hypothetical protein